MINTLCQINVVRVESGYDPRGLPLSHPPEKLLHVRFNNASVAKSCCNCDLKKAFFYSARFLGDCYVVRVRSGYGSEDVSV